MSFAGSLMARLNRSASRYSLMVGLENAASPQKYRRSSRSRYRATEETEAHTDPFTIPYAIAELEPIWPRCAAIAGA